MADKKDLTRIEDLSEFLHQDDPDVEAQLSQDEGPEEESPSDFNLPDVPLDSADDQTGQDQEFLEQETPPAFEENDTAETSDFSMPQEEGLPPDLPLSEDLAQESFESENFQDFNQEQTTQNFIPDDSFDSPQETNEQQEQMQELVQLKEEAPSIDELPQSAPYIAAKEDDGPTTSGPQDFGDVKQFAQSLSYGPVKSVGNPPYALLIKKIKYKEEARDIYDLLEEFGIINSDNASVFEKGLELGQLLVGQLSEYAAVYLAHRLRRFDLEIHLGLNEEIHPTGSYPLEKNGPLHKENLYQNRQDAGTIDGELNPKDIIIATVSILENHQVMAYLGPVHAQMVVDSDQFLEEQENNQADFESSSFEAMAPEQLKHNNYQELLEQIRAKAFKLRANAVIGVNFSLTPLPASAHQNSSLGLQYQLSCIGNAVIAKAIAPDLIRPSQGQSKE